MTRAMSRVITMDPNAGIQKLRAASCSVLLLLLTLALVASSLLVARYAVQASSWWLSLLAVTVCLLGLCTWIQLAASRAGRWRAVLARQMVLSRAQAAQAQARALRGVPGLGHDPYSCGGGAGRCGVATISTAITAEGGLDCQVPYRVAGPPPPPPYALPDLPPSYSVSVAAADSSATPAPLPAPAAGPAPPQPAPGLEPPPPYAVAIKRDPLVQGATTGGSTDTAAVQAERAVDSCSDANSTSVLSFSVNGRGGGSVVVLGSGAPGVSARERERARSSNAANRRPILWY